MTQQEPEAGKEYDFQSFLQGISDDLNASSEKLKEIKLKIDDLLRKTQNGPKTQ